MRTVVACAAVIAFTASARLARAQATARGGSPAPGASALSDARSASKGGDCDHAPVLFRKALEEGGLSYSDVVEAWVQIGACLATTGRRRAAISAFRTAALLDPGFRVPPQASRKVAALADRERRLQVRSGSLTLGAETPGEVDAGTSFGVEVTMAPESPAVHSVVVEARDLSTEQTFLQDLPARAHLHFEVPSRMTTPGATIVIDVEAHDGHDNQLALSEKRVHVATAPSPPPAVATAVAQRTSPAPLAPLAPLPEPRPVERSPDSGFWHSAWPYVLGGAAILAGGVAVYFAVRPTDNPNILGTRAEGH